MMKPVLLILTAILLLPNFLKKDINEQLKYNGLENYDLSLSHIRSVDQLEHYADSLAIEKNIDPQSAAYFELLEKIISSRFYHGFSHYKLSDNWIASLGQKITGVGLACKVEPADILKDPNAACSQQSIVMMEIIRRKEMDYRKTGFPHHYALEINVKDDWYYFDCNMEPSMTIDQRNHASWQGQNDILKKYYDPGIHKDLDYQFGKGETAILGAVNADPAPNLILFHQVSAFSSKFLWLIPFLIWLKMIAPAFSFRNFFSPGKSPEPEFSI